MSFCSILSTVQAFSYRRDVTARKDNHCDNHHDGGGSHPMHREVFTSNTVFEWLKQMDTWIQVHSGDHLCSWWQLNNAGNIIMDYSSTGFLSNMCLSSDTSIVSPFDRSTMYSTVARGCMTQVWVFFWSKEMYSWVILKNKGPSHACILWDMWRSGKNDM